MIPTKLCPPAGETEGQHEKRVGETASVVILPAPRRKKPSRSTVVWHVHAQTFRVLGRTRDRFALVVLNCPRCSRAHEHCAPPEFISGMRTAPCGVRYVVHALEGGGGV